MRIDTPPITRVPRDDEIDVFAISHAGKGRKTNQDRFLLATINKRVNLISSNLDEEERLPVGDQRLAYLAMIADGVGGGTGGAEASATRSGPVPRATGYTCPRSPYRYP